MIEYRWVMVFSILMDIAHFYSENDFEWGHFDFNDWKFYRIG